MLSKDALEEFIYDCEIRNLSKRTIKHYNQNVGKLLVFLEREYHIKNLEKISPPLLKAYIAHLRSLELKETYINSLLKGANSFFNYCVQESYMEINPMNRVKYLKQPITLINTFSDSEVKRMVAYFKGTRFLEMRNQLIIFMLFDTGIRNNELCELKCENVRETYILIQGKGNKERTVPISPVLNKALIKYKRIRNIYIKDKITYQTEYLFLSQKGKMLTKETVERIVKICGEGCNVRPEIRCSPHTCRHYFAQAQLRNGCDLYSLSRLLGHTNPNITKIYLQSMQSDDFLEMTVGTSPLMNL